MVRALWIGLAALFLVPTTSVAQVAESIPDRLPPAVFKERRERLMERIGPGVAVLYNKGSEDRDGFKSDPNFYYLTGLDEDGAILVLAPGERRVKEFLFLPALDPEADRWVGVRAMLGDSLRLALGFERIYRTRSLNSILLRTVQRNPTLHHIAPAVSPSAPRSKEMELYSQIQSRVAGVSTANHQTAIAEMRHIKDAQELRLMEKAIDITIAAHRAAAAAIKPGVEENWIAGLIDLEYRRGGSVRQAFPSIIGSGINSCILHYPDHNNTIADGDLVVVDIGAEYDHYAADITRTYPANGRFSPEQREIYDLVLRVQEACIKMVKPGVYRNDIHDKAVEMFREAGMADYFFHGLSHWVGLYVHDVGDRERPLEPGMVLTIEPGLYIADKQIGVRIEDEVLVTRNGYRVLTEALPRDAAEIEAMMRAETKAAR